MYHIQQESISHTRPPSLQYRQTHGIENMETDAFNYQAQQPLHVSQAVTHTERPRQTESHAISHIPQQSISHTQPPAIQYDPSHTIYHIRQQSI